MIDESFAPLNPAIGGTAPSIRFLYFHLHATARPERIFPGRTDSDGGSSWNHHQNRYGRGKCVRAWRWHASGNTKTELMGLSPIAGFRGAKDSSIVGRDHVDK